MKIPYYQVDAFTSETFRGNPAGVCILNEWLDDHILQNIAMENNLSETAFIKEESGYYSLRWFTPTLEMDLCGHATLAPAFVLFSELGHSRNEIKFHTKSGLLTAIKRNQLIELNLPARMPSPCSTPDNLIEALGDTPLEVLKSRDIVAVFESEEQISTLNPDMELLKTLNCLGIIVTAPGNNSDFVSRFFAPRAGVPEDPVTGSAHCSLIPYWASKLRKNDLFARQISKRTGDLECRFLGDRVSIAGQAIVYSEGYLRIPVA